MTIVNFEKKRTEALARYQAEIETLKAVLGALASSSPHRDKVERLLKKLRLKAARLSIPVRDRAVVSDKARRKYH